MGGGFPFFHGGCNSVTYGISSATSTGTALPSFNTWTQLTASSTSDAEWIVVEGSYDLSGAGYSALVDIGIGASGSEVLILQGLNFYIGSTAYCFPVAIPAGTRVAARAAYGQATGTYVKITLVDGSLDRQGCCGAIANGFVAFQGGTAITPSATANTKGSYAQLIASTAADYEGLIVHPDYAQSQGNKIGKYFLLDVAIGGAGSEQIVVPDMFIYAQHLMPVSYYPIQIPAGTRIAARCQANAASVNDMGLTVYGINK